MEKLYLYKLNEETGEISLVTVEQYEHGRWANNKPYYKFKNGGINYYCKEEDIDVVKNWHIYTFVEGEERARGMFLKYLNDKYECYRKEADRFSNAISKII